jgi:4-hydroxy 2-oxovalerate aldolase
MDERRDALEAGDAFFIVDYTLKMLRVAEDVGRPLWPSPPELGETELLLGYAGVYSSFLLHAERAAERFGVAAADIIVEVGRRNAVGGQEDLIVDVAAELAGAGSSAS